MATEATWSSDGVLHDSYALARVCCPTVDGSEWKLLATLWKQLCLGWTTEFGPEERLGS